MLYKFILIALATLTTLTLAAPVVAPVKVAAIRNCPKGYRHLSTDSSECFFIPVVEPIECPKDAKKVGKSCKCTLPGHVYKNPVCVQIR